MSKILKFTFGKKFEAHIHRTDIAKTLQNAVVSRSQRNFQWVVLVIPRVLTLYKSRKSIVTIHAMIQNVPTELHELYTGLLSLVEDHERAQSLRFMQWICFSFEPLTLRELRFALALNPDIPHTSVHQCQNSEFYVDTDENMKPVIYDLSKGLAEVQEHDGELIVQYIHESVQDFLLEKGFQILNNSIAGNVVGHGHLWLSRSCIEYLSIADFVLCNNKARLARMEEITFLSLLEYSSKYWLSHVQMLENANMSQNDLAALSTEVSDLTLHEYFFSNATYYDFFFCKRKTTLLHIVTELNLINITKAVLPRIVRADQTDGYGQTSLSVAAKKGHSTLVDLLLARGEIDVNHEDSEGDTPLSSAVREGHEVVVKLLLNREDVDVNCKDSTGGTPLLSAIREGHEVVVKFLLNGEDVDVNYKATSGVTPLSSAAAKGYKAVVELLMNREGVDLNSVDRHGDTPLSRAAEYGHTATVRTLLIKENVDVNHENFRGHTPLYLAAMEGRTAVVEVLLQGNANPNIRANFGRMPLTLAALHGHYDVVDLLLQHNADTDVRDTFDHTPLSLAASKGHCEIVKLLLQGTSNADSIDKYGRTPLSFACRGGYKNIAGEFLKRSDVDVNSRDIYGRSVLSWAIVGYFSTMSKDRKDIVDLLLSRRDIFIHEADEEALEKFRSEERRQEALSCVPLAQWAFRNDDEMDTPLRPIEEGNWVFEGAEDCNRSDGEDLSESPHHAKPSPLTQRLRPTIYDFCLLPSRHRPSFPSRPPI